MGLKTRLQEVASVLLPSATRTKFDFSVNLLNQKLTWLWLLPRGGGWGSAFCKNCELCPLGHVCVLKKLVEFISLPLMGILSAETKIFAYAGLTENRQGYTTGWHSPQTTKILACVRLTENCYIAIMGEVSMQKITLNHLGRLEIGWVSFLLKLWRHIIKTQWPVDKNENNYKILQLNQS